MTLKTSPGPAADAQCCQSNAGMGPWDLSLPLFFLRRRLCYKMAITSRTVRSVPQTVCKPFAPLTAPSFAS